ncbi:hypothetical protein DKM44_08310 [Deinococcus irradiatisoli]|uniref:Uncharacterized protein n=1 Tax=Deinococcus irradiatisoli TaxID=2202254 RepID=A0A2Z3JKY2_9DEIO|nr:hypothetical protein DKM44_08310 [Deinococcus irradiatisoli]
MNLLGANAAYLPADVDASTLSEATDWARQHDVPPLRLLLGSGGEAGHLRVGTVHSTAEPGALHVEQLSRLHLPRWAAVLAEAHGQPEWALPISRHLAARLEGPTHATLLMAYAGSEEVGALLWQPSGAHLWGTLDPAVDAPLLSAAAELGGGETWASLPDSSPMSLMDEQGVSFAHLPYSEDR